MWVHLCKANVNLAQTDHRLQNYYVYINILTQNKKLIKRTYQISSTPTIKVGFQEGECFVNRKKRL